MSGKVTGAIWDLDLSYSKQLVLLAMADHADHDGGNVFAGIDLIAYKTGYSQRQVQRIIHQCTKDGVLKVVAKATNRKPTTYQIDISAGKKKPERLGRQIVTSKDTVTGQIVTPGHTPSGQNVTSRGDIQMSPDPSYNRQNTNTILDSPNGLSIEAAQKEIAELKAKIAEMQSLLDKALHTTQGKSEEPPTVPSAPPSTVPANIPDPEPAHKSPPHIAIIEMWWEHIPPELRPIGKPDIKRNCRVAAELRDAGITPERIGKFMDDRYPSYRAWCIEHDKPPLMYLEYVKKFIPSWMTADNDKQAMDIKQKMVADEAEQFMMEWCDKCDRPKLYCICAKKAQKPIESVVVTCWEHARSILTVILPKANRKMLSQIKPIEKRGDALVLEVSNPVFRDQLELTLASTQFTDPIKLLSGGELTNFRVVVA